MPHVGALNKVCTWGTEVVILTSQHIMFSRVLSNISELIRIVLGEKLSYLLLFAPVHRSAPGCCRPGFGFKRQYLSLCDKYTNSQNLWVYVKETEARCRKVTGLQLTRLINYQVLVNVGYICRIEIIIKNIVSIPRLRLGY